MLMLLGAVIAGAAGADAQTGSVVLFEDGFAQMRSGSLGSVVGAHAEYHYLPEVAPKNGWSVTAFSSSAYWQRAWRVGRHNDRSVLLQTFHNTNVRHYHPMVVAGDEQWRDYTLSVRFAPENDRGRCGVAFRYRNSRCYYFFGVEARHAVLKLVRHETDFRVPFEKTLAQTEFSWEAGTELRAEVGVQGRRLQAKLNDTLTLAAEDDTYPQGRIALVSDVPARFISVRVTATPAEQARVAAERAKIQAEGRALQAANPRPVVWKKLRTDGFGVGRNLRFGDLDGDGQMDILFCQPVHHGPKDANSEVSCLTAMTLEGKLLWQIGQPDPWKDHLSNDVAFQIHDLDGDGRNEVVYCKDMELIVAEGATGKTRRKTPTPETAPNTKPPRNCFPRILGDSLFFCDLRGQGRAGDIVLKDRYESFWIFAENLTLLWKAQCNTGHYPFAYDVNGDGKDELFIGYSLFDHTGKRLWTLDDQLKDHADGVAVVKFSPDTGAAPRVMLAASDEGMLFLDLQGRVLHHHRLGHVQNPVVADFRPDLPGLETLSINFWGNQGIVHCFDAHGNLYHDFEPCHHGSMMLPVNWTGQPPEYWVLSPNVEEGGLFDGWGRKVVSFPADGHPDMCCAVLDLTGDCRDEIVVWDPYELWVYTQSDNPKPGRLYKPKRNSLSNYSNYQATVSLPGWAEANR